MGTKGGWKEGDVVSKGIVGKGRAAAEGAWEGGGPAGKEGPRQ